MSQPVPMSPPPLPPPPPQAVAAAGKKKSKTVVILASVFGGLIALCCLGGVIAVVAADPKPSAAPTGLANPRQTADVKPPVVEPAATQPQAQQPADTKPALPPGTITDTGDLLVGTDIQPDTYRGVGCGYWARLKNADGDLDSVLANGNVGSEEYLTVTILKSDYAFDNSCTNLFPISGLRAVAQSNTSNEFGTLVVGKDIHPGTWRGTATGPCYWARTSGFTGSLDEVLANDNVSAGSKFTITVKASDKGLELGSACGTLTKAA